MRVRRTDVVTLDGATRTKEGYIDTFGNLTKTGVFEYRREDGTMQRELRLPEHVFSADSMKSFDGQTLALQHPLHNIDATTFKQHVAGFVLSPQKHEDGIHVRARVKIMDAEAVKAYDSGVRELSNGYDTDLVPVPGGVFRRDDWDGGKETQADYIQTNIRGNHTAIVDKGRAGPTARLDSAGNQQENDSMDPKDLQKKIDELTAKSEVDQKLHAERSAELEKLKGEKAALEAEVAKQRKADQERAVTKLVERAAPVVKIDAAELAQLGEEGIMRTALKKLSPEIKTDGWSAQTLAGAFEVAMAHDAKRVDSATIAAQAVAGTKNAIDHKDADENASEAAYQKMRAGFANAYKTAGKKE